MQFMVSVSVAAAATPPGESLRESEYEAVRELYMDGTIRQIWLRGDGSGGYLIVEAPSADDVAEKFGVLPMVRAGVLERPTIVALVPYGGFAPRS